VTLESVDEPAAIDAARRTRRVSGRAGGWLKDPFFVIGLAIVTVFVVFAIAPGLIAPRNPTELDVASQLLPPSGEHLMGTDEVGRDLFTRVVHGTRYSLGMAAAVVAIGALIGIVVGALAGLAGGFVDNAVMRIVDVFLSLPVFVLAMAMAAVLGRGILPLVVALGLVWWPGYARIVRGMVMSVGKRQHVESARALGAGPLYILRRHILPFTVGQLNVRITQDMGFALVAVAGLSFIGLGVRPPTPEWGLMVSASRTHLVEAWWYPLFPGLMIALVTIGLSMLGDALAERSKLSEASRG
jgi:peptide/nickel transport system permease protein